MGEFLREREMLDGAPLPVAGRNTLPLASAMSCAKKRRYESTADSVPGSQRAATAQRPGQYWGQ